MPENNEERRVFEVDREYALDLWREHETVAMHFNDLLIRLRVQALGGVSAIGAIVGILVKESTAPHSRWMALTAVFGALSVLWVAIAILDLFYYNRLLIGAIQSLIDIEELTRDGRVPVGIDLSTRIRRAVERPEKRWRRSLRALVAFYGLVFLVLAVLTLLAVWEVVFA